MSDSKKTIALHDRWRRALEGEDFTPFYTEQNMWPKMNDRRSCQLNYRRALYETLRHKMYRNGRLLRMISDDDLVEEAQLMVKLFKAHDDLTGSSRTFGHIYDIKKEYGFPRLSRVLLAVWGRLTTTESRLQDLQGNRGPEEANVEINLYSSAKLQQSNDDLKEEICELIEAHKVEIAALMKKNANDKHTFALYSRTLSRILHDMAVHIRTDQKEKIALKAVYDAEIHALHNHIAEQRTLIDSMISFIKETTDFLSVNRQPRYQQDVTPPETMPPMQDKDIVIRDLKQEMERKEQSWEAERKKYEEEIAEMKNTMERMQTWEGEDGAQWDPVGKKKLKGKGREF